MESESRASTSSHCDSTPVQRALEAAGDLNISDERAILLTTYGLDRSTGCVAFSRERRDLAILLLGSMEHLVEGGTDDQIRTNLCAKGLPALRGYTATITSEQDDADSEVGEGLTRLNNTPRVTNLCQERPHGRRVRMKPTRLMKAGLGVTGIGAAGLAVALGISLKTLALERERAHNQCIWEESCPGLWEQGVSFKSAQIPAYAIAGAMAVTGIIMASVGARLERTRPRKASFAVGGSGFGFRF